MNREALQAFFRMGMLILVASALLLFAQTPGTAGFVVTTLSICIGAVLCILVALVARMQ